MSFAFAIFGVYLFTTLTGTTRPEAMALALVALLLGTIADELSTIRRRVVK